MKLNVDIYTVIFTHVLYPETLNNMILMAFINYNTNSFTQWVYYIFIIFHQ